MLEEGTRRREAIVAAGEPVDGFHARTQRSFEWLRAIRRHTKIARAGVPSLQAAVRRAQLAWQRSRGEIVQPRCSGQAGQCSRHAALYCSRCRLRILVIGLDAATFDLVDPWASAAIPVAECPLVDDRVPSMLHL